MKVKYYFSYKFFNSIFAGLSIGSVFTLYQPLSPSIFSVGGILLALGSMVIAKFYEKIMNRKMFFRISLFVEMIMLFIVVFFLLKPFSYTTALCIYSGYQITFLFGSYLVRTETIILRYKKLLSVLDIVKQAGYLIGLVLSYGFYNLIEIIFYITSNQLKVFYIHFLLFFIQITVITFLMLAFNKRERFRLF